MPLPALVLLAALAAAPQGSPIVVTGRGGVPFISPMGEPIRARTPNEDTLARWFYQVDRNRDGFLTPDELVADAQRYFAILDTNNDGQIDPDELAHYEWTIAPEIQVNSRLRRAREPGEKPDKADTDPSGGDGDHARRQRPSDRNNVDYGPQGAARYALLNIPEPIAQADADLNRSISLQEFRQAALDRFQLLDKQHAGRLTLQQLETMKPVLTGKRRKHRDDDPDDRIGVPLPPGD
jgi:Ca2+-binding EF-hand superfamily protein